MTSGGSWALFGAPLNLTRVFSDPREKEFLDLEESLSRTGCQGRRILSIDLVLCLQRRLQGQDSGLLARESRFPVFQQRPRPRPHAPGSAPRIPPGPLPPGQLGGLAMGGGVFSFLPSEPPRRRWLPPPLPLFPPPCGFGIPGGVCSGLVSSEPPPLGAAGCAGRRARGSPGRVEFGPVRL